MAKDSGFMEHWIDIDPERMERYETMYQWNRASEKFYEPAQLGEGQIVADFGCGPGHAAIEFARRVGPTGHIHAFDINAEFVSKARARAEQFRFGDRITIHLLEDAGIPLADNSLDRVIARNTIIYVEDPAYTFGEFRRTLRPGGIAHAIEGDWNLTVVEPVPTEEWRELINAASWAWPRPEMGRTLYGYARRAGFGKVSVQVVTVPDTNGRLNGMIQTVAGYARKSGKMKAERIDAILERIEIARKQETYLAISPQFLVTAVAE